MGQELLKIGVSNLTQSETTLLQCGAGIITWKKLYYKVGQPCVTTKWGKSRADNLIQARQSL